MTRGFAQGSNEIAFIADLSAQAALMKNVSRAFAANDFPHAIQAIERAAA